MDEKFGEQNFRVFSEMRERNWCCKPLNLFFRAEILIFVYQYLDFQLIRWNSPVSIPTHKNLVFRCAFARDYMQTSYMLKKKLSMNFPSKLMIFIKKINQISIFIHPKFKKIVLGWRLLTAMAWLQFTILPVKRWKRRFTPALPTWAQR